MSFTSGSTPWSDQPKSNTHLVYLREDVPSAYVIELFDRVCRDHGFTTKRNQDGTTLEATAKGGKKDMELKFVTGRHEIKGNVMVIEYDDHLAETVILAIGAVLVVVAVVAVIAIASSGNGGGGGGHGHHSGGGSSSGGGGGYHHHHHHHSSSSNTFIYWGPWHTGGGTSRSTRRRRALGGAYMYNQYNINPEGTTGALPHTNVVSQAQTFENREEFFKYFFANVDQFFWNAGLARVPDQAVLEGIRHNAIPLKLGQAYSGKVKTLGTAKFCFEVPTDACVGQTPTLQVDVLCSKSPTIRLKKNRKGSALSSNTATAQKIGNNMFVVAAGPGHKLPEVTPGFWFVTVSVVEACEFTVATTIFSDTDKTRHNTKLFGSFKSQTIQEDGDDWELLETDEAGPATPAVDEITYMSDKPPPYEPSLRPLGDGGALTQGTDLSLLTDQRLKQELLDRSIVWPPGASHSALEALLFPLLPPAPVVYDDLTTKTEAPSSAGNGKQPATSVPSDACIRQDDQTLPTAPLLRDESEDDIECPENFLCPLTLEIMKDPVFTADGHTYERDAIATWLLANDTSPMTGLRLPHKRLVENYTLRAVITAYLQSQ